MLHRPLNAAGHQPLTKLAIPQVAGMRSRRMELNSRVEAALSLGQQPQLSTPGRLSS